MHKTNYIYKLKLIPVFLLFYFLLITGIYFFTNKLVYAEDYYYCYGYFCCMREEGDEYCKVFSGEGSVVYAHDEDRLLESIEEVEPNPIVFVPIKTAEEWAEFRIHAPSFINIETSWY